MRSTTNLTKKIVLVTLTLICIILLSSTIFAKTFTIQETDEISLDVIANDPDNDNLIYYYTSPFDDNGYWRTGYDDAGQYDVNITASDGQEQTVETITIIVEEKNQAPSFTETKVEFSEGDLIDLTKYIEDDDNDILEFDFDDPFDDNGLWQTGYDAAGRYVVDVVVNDGDLEVQERLEIIIEQTNVAPEIVDSFSDEKIVSLEENEELPFFVEADDFDSDELEYLWLLDGKEAWFEQEGIIKFDYNTSGEHTFEAIVSDVELNTTQEWILDIENVNRKPIVDDLEVRAFETETIKLDLNWTDLDGDELTYIFEDYFDENGEWETGYEDAGNYSTVGVVSDGENEVEFDVEIEIVDVDRRPVLNLPDRLEISEGQDLEWELDSYDPDGDELTFSFSGLSTDAEFDEDSGELLWEVPYDYIVRKSNFFYDFLNSLRIEHWFMGKKSDTIEVTVCGKELCQSGEFELVVYNTNQAPIITELYDQEILETESLELYTKAEDLDGDIVRITYTDPVGKRSGKMKTDYDSKGVYYVYVTASDGFLTDTEMVTITVQDNNRAPSIDIKHDDLVVNEGQEFMISLDVEDPDNDNLTITLDNLPDGAVIDGNIFLWKPTYDAVAESEKIFWSNLVSKSSYLNKKFSKASETYWLDFTVSDGEYEVVHPVKVEVKDVNRAPVVINYTAVEAVTDAGQRAVEFEIDLYDLDGDDLDFEWSFSGINFNKVESTNKISRVFTTPGEKKVKVEVSDGRDKIEQEWTVHVEGTLVTKKLTKPVAQKVVSQPKKIVVQPEPAPAAKNPPGDFLFYVVEDWKD